MRRSTWYGRRLLRPGPRPEPTLPAHPTTPRREDTHFAANCYASTGVGALDDDEDDHYVMADGDDGEGAAGGKKTKPGSRAGKAVPAGARKKPGPGAKRKPAARAPAKAKGGVRKLAPKKPRAKPATKKAAPRKT